MPDYEFIDPICDDEIPSPKVSSPDPTPLTPGPEDEWPEPKKTDCGPFGNLDKITQKCQNKCSGMAYGWGDTHYMSFDGRVTHYQGNCLYKLSGLCDFTSNSSQNLDHFELRGRQQKKPGYRNQAVTFLYGWEFEWKNVNLKFDLNENSRKVKLIEKDSDIQVNIKSPHFYNDLQILTEGKNSQTIYFGIENFEQAKNPNKFFKIKLVYNHNHYLKIHLDCIYKNKVCGLLGNFDDDRRNDWMLQNGEIMKMPIVGKSDQADDKNLWKKTFYFGNSWLVESKYCPNGSEDNDNIFVCTENDRKLIKSERYCGKLNTYPFTTCTLSKIELDLSFQTCIYDLCMVDREKYDEMICNVLTEYEEKCHETNQNFDQWRTAKFCPSAINECSAYENMAWNHEAPKCFLTTENCQPGKENHLNNESIKKICDNMLLIPACECSKNFPIWDITKQKCVANCPVLFSDARFGDNQFYTWGADQLKPIYAIDGIIDYQGRNFAMSKKSGAPSSDFYLTLKTACKIKQIIVYPRKDAGYDRYQSCPCSSKSCSEHEHAHVFTFMFCSCSQKEIFFRT